MEEVTTQQKQQALRRTNSKENSQMRQYTNASNNSSSNNNKMDPTRHRFQTKMSLCLTAFVIVSFGGLSLHTAYTNNNNNSSSSTSSSSNIESRFLADTDYSYEGHSCHDLFSTTPDAGDEQCQFAKQCNGGEGVWLPFTFCSTFNLGTMAWCGILSPFVLVWMILMFRLLGSTAEDYFSPSLEYFSLKAKLPPRFAGVTLLALGNGAADVSATVNAITSDPDHGYEMALGALTGAAMFVGGVVSAVVILVAGGVPCRGALVRDVLCLAVTTVVVWVHLSSGSIGPEAISLFLTLYGVFVVVVLVADAYHRGVVLPRMGLEDQETERHRQMQAADDVLAAGSPGGGNTMGFHNPGAAAPAQTTSALGNVLSALSNYDRVQPNNNNNQDGMGGAGGGTNGWGVDADDIGQERPHMLHGAAGIIRGNPNMHHSPPDDIGGDMPYSALEEAGDRLCAESGPAGGSISYNWSSAWEEGKQEIRDHANQVWDDIAYNGDLHPVEKFFLMCELPFTFLRKVTVSIPCDGYYCRGLVALSMAVSPLWLGYYLWYEHGVNVFSLEGLFYMGTFWAILVGMSALVLRYAPAGEGNMALFAATPIALYGFIIGATWIDAIADHLVKMLDFLGILLRIPGPVIGLTVLAWGNSIADLSANVAMARKGLANMAMTACFAGPVFNILIGLGLGFSSLAAQEKKSSVSVKMDSSVVTGFVFVLLNCAAILGVGIFLGKGRIPKEHGYLALTLYSLYVVISVVLQYTTKK